jgi:diacylglycerol O-acyltransferase
VEHLTSFDAGFLEAEDSDRHVSLAMGALSIIEGPMPEFRTLTAGIADRVGGIPRLRQILRTRPLDLGAPEWVVDQHFDLSHHVHRVAVTSPGDEPELFRLTADLMERRLDRDRPLWDCWIIEGLSEGRWGLLMKVHHCIADGVGAMHMLSGLGDDVDAPTFASDLHIAKRAPTKVSGALPNSLNPLNWVPAIWNLGLDATRTMAKAIGGAVDLAAGIIAPASSSSLNGPVTSMRRFSAASVTMTDVAAVRQAFDVTVNDVVLAAITDGFRAVLMNRGEQPRARSVRTLVPVSTRAGDARGQTHNSVSLVLPYLPVDEEDPLEQLKAVHQRLTRAKAGGQRDAGNAFVAAMNAMPFAATAWAVRALMKLPQRGVTALATNVPGPRNRLRIMGREVLRIVPIPPLAMQLRTGIAILSYGEDLVFGIVGDYDSAPDVDELARGIERGVARLVALTG